MSKFTAFRTTETGLVECLGVFNSLESAIGKAYMTLQEIATNIFYKDKITFSALTWTDSSESNHKIDYDIIDEKGTIYLFEVRDGD